MNKKMRDLLTEIETKTAEARSLMDTKEVAKATEALNEVDALKAEFEAEKKLFELEQEKAPEEKVEPKKTRNALEEFGKAAKNGFRVKTNDYDGTLNETVGADGGYAVPEDIVTKVEELRDAEISLRDYVRVEKVSTKSGARTFKKRSQMTGFTLVGEAGKIGAAATPEFDRVDYSIKKYAGYLPITNELKYDSDANIAQVVIDWLGNEARVTDNANILAAVATNGTAVDFKDLDGIKAALNVTLGSAFKATSAIYTNDDGLQYLDTLKEASDSNKYLLSPDPANPMALRVNAGATSVPLVVIPNAQFPTTEGKIPFIIGDLSEGIVFFDRELITIAESELAAIGGLNAFEQDLTIYRAITRSDVEVRDDGAFVHGYISGE